MSKPTEIDFLSRQQIAFFAGLIGTIAVLMLISHNSQANPLVIGFVAYVLSFVISLISRAAGVGIILIGSLLILRGCGMSSGS